MLKTLATPGTVFHKFEFVGSIGLIFFREIVLGATDTAVEGNKNAGSFFGFGGHIPEFYG